LNIKPFPTLINLPITENGRLMNNNWFGGDSVCDEIVSADAKQAMKLLLRMLSLRMQ
jgi:hypothetical protein